MSEDKIKQVIVMRTDLNMRKGKMCSQAAHASMMFMCSRLKYAKENPTPLTQQIDNMFSYTEQKWLFDGLFTKITAQVSSEEELMDIYNKAQEANLTVHLVEDNGLTEFKGVKTKTCLAIGPHKSSKIDPVTGHLKLL